MQSIEYNLEFAQLMMDELKSYLLSNETFWPLGEQPKSSGPPFPRMSLGQMLLALDELQVQAEAMSPRQISQYQELSEQFDEQRSERPANLEKKAWSEVQQRANLWSSYLDDLRASNRAVESYAQDVTNRVILERLQTFLSEGEELEELMERVHAVDRALRGIFQKGGFIWHPRLKPLYERENYWFLYGRPIPQDNSTY
ncbi:MAG: hypothetical protein ACLFWD_04720 [Anaerolineales bacterium]